MSRSVVRFHSNYSKSSKSQPPLQHPNLHDSFSRLKTSSSGSPIRRLFQTPTSKNGSSGYTQRYFNGDRKYYNEDIPRYYKGDQTWSNEPRNGYTDHSWKNGYASHNGRRDLKNGDTYQRYRSKLTQDKHYTPRNFPQKSFNTLLHRGSIHVKRTLPNDVNTQNLLKNLKKVPVLSALDDRELFELSEEMEEKVFYPNQIVIAQGDVGRGFFIIKHGLAIISREDPRTKEINYRRELQEGEFFGEAALLRNVARGASIRAKTKLVVYFLDKSKFQRLFKSNRFAKRPTIYVPDKDSSGLNAGQNSSQAKGSELTNMIFDALKNTVLFCDVAPVLLNRIIAKMSIKKVVAGEYVVREGEQNDQMYVVDTGVLKVLVNGQSPKLILRGKCFEEMALLCKSPSIETVRADQDSILWSIDRTTYLRTVRDVSQYDLDKRANYFVNIPFFSSWKNCDLAKLVDTLEKEVFPAGETIINQGESGHHLYLITKGQAKILMGPTVIRRINVGGYVCENALSTKNYKSECTVMCNTPVTCLKLDRNVVDIVANSICGDGEEKSLSIKAESPSYLSPLQSPLPPKLEEQQSKHFKIVIDPKKVTKKKIPETQASTHLNDKIEKVEMDTSIQFENLEYKALLGTGMFGKVTLVEDKSNQKKYALKAVSIDYVVKSGHKIHLLNERNTMLMLDHPFLIKLHRTFKDESHLYFLLQPCLGGELFTVLRNRSRLANDEARFYTASVLLAFEYMHSKNIIYRDLKPENLLLDRQGFLMITDFGFAKLLDESGRTYTLCGTPDYLAPEVIAQSRGHGKGADWWCLGILTYEMLADQPPFQDNNTMRQMGRIKALQYQCPDYFTDEVKDFLKKLLTKRKSERWGVIGGAKQVKEHKWFNGFSFEDLVNKNLTPPITPKISGPYDVSNFDDYGEPTEEQGFTKKGVAAYTGDTEWYADF